MVKTVPLYSIDRFIKHQHKRAFEIEVFDKHRNFKVVYPHRHDFYEILYITDGTGQHEIDGRKYQVTSNSVFFLSPGQIHSLSLSEDIKGYIFLFTREFFIPEHNNEHTILEYPFFYNISNESPPLHIDNISDNLFLTLLFKQACKENNDRSAAGIAISKSLLTLILNYCKRLYPHLATESKIHKGKILVKRYKLAIEENYQLNLSISDYASKLAVTANHLNETVKRHTGVTATSILKEKIIMEIKRLLTHTDYTISEIAFAFNFSDQSYFSKYFRQNTGQSPVDFRRAIKST